MIQHGLLILLAFGFAGRVCGQAQSDTAAELSADNSKVFVQYSSPHKISEIIALWKKANRPSPVIVEHPLRTEGGGSVPGRTSVYPAQFLIDLFERTTLVVIIHFTASQAHMTGDSGFLYLNFAGTVDQVLLDPDNSIVAGDQVYVTRAGGTLTVDGEVVKAIDPEFAAFDQGAKYLLFLSRVPGSRFFSARAPASFEPGKMQPDGTEGEVKALDAHPPQALSEGSRANAVFIDEVQNAVLAALEEQRTENL